MGSINWDILDEMELIANAYESHNRAEVGHRTLRRWITEVERLQAGVKELEISNLDDVDRAFVSGLQSFNAHERSVQTDDPLGNGILLLAQAYDESHPNPLK